MEIYTLNEKEETGHITLIEQFDLEKEYTTKLEKETCTEESQSICQAQ